MSGGGIILNRDIFIKQTHFGEKCLKKRNSLITELMRLTNVSSNNITINPIDIAIKIKGNFVKKLQDLYKIDFSNNFNEKIYKNLHIISQEDLKIAQKIIFLENIINILDDKNFNKIFSYFKNMDKIWKDIEKWPETVTHNDIHPMNFIESNDGKVYLIDFGHTGRNKRIVDFSFVVETNNNPSEEVIKSMINGYRINGGGHISEKELSNLYEVWKAIEISNFFKDLVKLNNMIENKDNYDEIRHKIDLSKNLSKIENLDKQSKNSNILKIFDDSQNEMIEGLDLANQKIKPVRRNYLI